jgi:hypothetical protein
MEIDAAVESVRLVVATHLVASVLAGRPDPASWLPVPQTPAETPTLGPGAIPRSRSSWRQAPARHHRGHKTYPIAAPDPIRDDASGSS